MVPWCESGLVAVTAFGTVFVRSAEDLFRGHVGDAIDAVARSGAAAQPLVIVGQAKAEIGAGAAILRAK